LNRHMAVHTKKKNFECALIAAVHSRGRPIWVGMWSACIWRRCVPRLL
jgi:hypothetical protein